MSRTLSEEQRAEIEHAVHEASSRGVEVAGVEIAEREEPSEHYILIEVKLAEPPAGSWPTDEFYDLRRRIRNSVVHTLGPEVELRMTYVPDVPVENAD